MWRPRQVGQDLLVPVAFLVLTALCLLYVLNAMRPVRWTPLVLPSFFAAWLTAELAPQLLVGLAVAVVAFVLLGALDDWPGWVALALCGVQAALLLRLVAKAQLAADVADEALAGWPDAADGPGPDGGPDVTKGLRRWFPAMAFRHPDVERVVDVRYAEDSPRNRLDVYRHRDHRTGCPTLLQVHGGGWVIGDKREQGRPLMLQLAARGWVCFAPNYRLSPRATFPDHLVDVKRALAWIREHGHEYGADPGFVVVTGGSAGGHLAAMAALTQNDPEYQPGFEDADTSVSGCVPYYGVYDIAGETGTKAARFRSARLMAKLVLKTRDPEAFAKASPIERVHPGAPPFMVVHGRNDTLVPVAEARLFVERLRAVTSEPVLYVELPGTQHAFDVFPSVRSAHVVRAVERFVELLRSRHAAATGSGATGSGVTGSAGPARASDAS